MRAVVIGILAVLVCACSPSTIVEKVLTPEERSIIRGAVDDVSRGDSASLSRKMPPVLAARVAPVFPKMRQALPPPPLEVSLSNANWASDGRTRRAKAVYEVKGKSGWALVEAATETTAGRTMLTSMYVQPTAVDPQQLNAFSLANAGAGGWIMLLVMAAAIAITVAALLRIWRSGRFDRRWLWTLGSLVGFVTFRYNWSTGALAFQPISFQIFSVSAFKEPIYAPWILGVSVPVVALIALFKQGYDSWDEPGIYPDAAATPD